MTTHLASMETATLTPDDLLVSGFPLLARKVTLISGQNVARGAVLGKITASGKYNLSLSAAGDGSQTPDAIAAENCDASGGDKELLVYTLAGVNENRLTLGTAHSLASIREGLRTKGIHLIDVQGA